MVDLFTTTLVVVLTVLTIKTRVNDKDGDTGCLQERVIRHLHRCYSK